MTSPLIRQSVLDGWLAYTAPLEGEAVPHMYVDIIGLVTVAYGNLIDGSQHAGNKTPWAPALALRWRWPDGGLASTQQVIADWQNLKQHEASLRRRSLATQASYTKVRLNRQDCDDLVFETLHTMAKSLQRRHFPAFATYPADAQLGILSLAWSAGADWPVKFPLCKAAILRRDWVRAAQEGVLSTTAADGVTPNPGVIPRNKAQRLCFANAHGVEFADLDPEPLHWPNDAGDGKPLYT
jgi:hypothetical protein